ncbi:DotU family type IV/VI secretion system protein [bacterium]|nr:DotU family type IV/VI secretion system protein [bacterium]
MNDRLAARVYPTILYVLELLDRIYGRKPGPTPDPREEFPRLKQYLGQLDSGKATREDELAKSALIYWIDEVLINSPWPHANKWKDHTLEREFYDARDRAYEFYEKAKIARTLSPADPLETYYLCVALGFLGIYREGEFKPRASGPAPPSNPQKPANAPPQKQKPAPRKAMDSWFGEADHKEEDAWDLPEESSPTAAPVIEPPADEDSLIDESVFDAPKTNAKQGSVDLPRTLSEWAGPVFAQIAPGRQRPFTPTTASDSQRDARPLTGWASCQRSLIALVWTLLATVILAVVWIVQRVG